MFGHERFKAYILAIQFTKIALEAADGIPYGHATIKDQLKRASLSIPLNIAEGSGKSQIPDRNRFYGIARGSAMECAAIFDVLVIMKPAHENVASEAKSLLSEIVAILTAVCNK